MIKSSMTLLCLVSIGGFSAYLHSADHTTPTTGLNRETRENYDARYAEIEQCDSTLPHDKKIALFQEARKIAQQMIAATQVLLGVTENDNRPKFQNEKPRLVGKYKSCIQLWNIRLQNTETMIKTLELEQLFTQQETDTRNFLQQSNLLNSTGMAALQNHYNTINAIHTKLTDPSQTDTGDHTKKLAEQIKREQDLLLVFNTQMNRAKEIVQDKDNALLALKQENERLKKTNAGFAKYQNNEASPNQLSSSIQQTEKEQIDSTVFLTTETKDDNSGTNNKKEDAATDQRKDCILL